MNEHSEEISIIHSKKNALFHLKGMMIFAIIQGCILLFTDWIPSMIKIFLIITFAIWSGYHIIEDFSKKQSLMKFNRIKYIGYCILFLSTIPNWAEFYSFWGIPVLFKSFALTLIAAFLVFSVWYYFVGIQKFTSYLLDKSRWKSKIFKIIKELPPLSKDQQKNIEADLFTAKELLEDNQVFYREGMLGLALVYLLIGIYSAFSAPQWNSSYAGIAIGLGVSSILMIWFYF